MALEDPKLVEAVLADFESAPIGEDLRATLRFLEKLTLRPAELTPQDAQAVRDAGVSAAALRDAIRVCSLFQLITRIADALKFEILSEEDLEKSARYLLRRGYA